MMNDNLTLDKFVKMKQMLDVVMGALEVWITRAMPDNDNDGEPLVMAFDLLEIQRQSSLPSLLPFGFPWGPRGILEETTHIMFVSPATFDLMADIVHERGIPVFKPGGERVEPPVIDEM